jgi:hypothetical protein
MECFKIASAPNLTCPIHSNSSQYDLCKVKLKQMTTSFPINPPKSAFLVLVTGLVAYLASLVTDPVLALLQRNSMLIGHVQSI